MSHIHLLSENAFTNHAPHHLVLEALAKLPQQYRYFGSEETPKNKNSYKHVFQKAVKKYTVN